MRRLVVLIFLLAAGSARADLLHFSRPGPYETALHLAALTTMALDTSTSLDIKNHRGGFEQNPLLPRHPSDAMFVGVGLGAMIVHTVLWYVAPDEVRPLLDLGAIGIEGWAAGSNMSKGFRLRIPFR